MNTREAKQLAVEWVEANWERFPGFAGPYFGGSISTSPDEAPWPPSSDVDITILADVPRGLDSVAYQGVVLGISTQPNGNFDLSPEAIVADFRRAIHFSAPSIIKDPTGALQKTHEYVRVEYPRKKWVITRCQGAAARCSAVLDGLLGQIGFGMDSSWGAVYSLYYAAFVAAEILALADLRNPTIRKSFVVSREVLTGCDRLDLQESLLQTLGAASFTKANVLDHLAEFKHAFTYAATVIRTPFFFSEDLTMDAAPRIFAGAQEILDMGLYREAIYWIHSMRALAQRAIETDAPQDDKARFQQTYTQLLADLDLEKPEQVDRHKQLVRSLLPQINEVAEAVMRNNPRIYD